MKPLTPASPHVIIMVGIPGAGKSTFAERFAETFEAPIVNHAKLQRELQLNNDQAEHLSDAILNELLKTHKTLLIDGGTDRLTKRLELNNKLKKAGYKPLLVWVQTDTQESRWRAGKPYPKGSGLTGQEFDEIIRQFDAPKPNESPIVISGKHTYTSQLKIVLRQLASSDENRSKIHPAPRDSTHNRILPR